MSGGLFFAFNPKKVHSKKIISKTKSVFEIGKKIENNSY
jgi:hypothetical protein